jgi:predicted transcriptional regulator
VKTELPKIYSKDLIELIFQNPYCKIRFLEEHGLGNRQTASSYLKQLADIGVLRALKVGREMYYINDDLLTILSEQDVRRFDMST